MKKLFLVFKFLLVLVCAVSCASFSSGSQEHKEIVKTAVDLANSYSQAGMHDKAEEVYLKALRRAPDDVLYFNLAREYALDGNSEKAVEICLKHKKYAFSKALISYLDKDSAISYINSFLEKDPYNKEMRLILAGLEDSPAEQGAVLYNMGFRDKDVITLLYEADPKTWEAVYNSF